ncbi:hypothetical protein SUGI_0337940 [Cryptomeria japonica]|nr:hypothetical protein SUGI_0337940 [Cryptomeria japonica]
MQNLALGAKLIWKIYRSLEKLWCTIIQKKYLDNDDPARILTAIDTNGGSMIWKFIKECRYIITDHISWKIGDGRRAKFWEDSWDGQESINKIFGDKEWIIEAKSKYGEYVADYAREVSPGSGIFEWKSIQLKSIEDSDYRKLTEILISRRIVIRD